MVGLAVMHPRIEILRGRALRVIRRDQFMLPFLVQIIQAGPDLARPL